MSTLSDLRSQTRELSGILLPAKTVADDAVVDRHINEQYLLICSLSEWDVLRHETSVPAAGDTVDLGAPMRVDTVVYETGQGQRQLLARRDWRWVVRQPTSKQGRPPEVWVPWTGNTLRVFPDGRAGDTLEVSGWKTPPALGSNDEPVFDAEFHPLFAYMAASALLQREGDDSGRAERYNSIVASFVGAMVRRHSQAAEQVIWPPSSIVGYAPPSLAAPDQQAAPAQEG